MKPKQEPKKYMVPKDTQALWNRYNAMSELRELYVKVRWFGYKLAVKASEQAEDARSEFWKQVYALYPILKKQHKISYDQYAGSVKVLEEKAPL